MGASRIRISAKGRYALAATVSLAQSYTSGDYITVISISEKLGISKIYLEQVFALLKRGGVVSSVKGAQGGYQLSRMPQKITVYDVLSAVETSLFEENDATIEKKAPDIEMAVRQLVYGRLDESVRGALGKVTLYDLTAEAEKYRPDDNFMFYI
jgi:Rrf2 family protein